MSLKSWGCKWGWSGSSTGSYIALFYIPSTRRGYTVDRWALFFLIFVIFVDGISRINPSALLSIYLVGDRPMHPPAITYVLFYFFSFFYTSVYRGYFLFFFFVNYCHMLCRWRRTSTLVFINVYIWSRPYRWWARALDFYILTCAHALTRVLSHPLHSFDAIIKIIYKKKEKKNNFLYKI